MSLDPGPVGYTPEISDELYSLIIDLYKYEIKPIITDLKLYKMLDLIEIGEFEFEQYQTHLMQKEFKTCLKYYILGLFYIYLIIPQSIQFQIKNKNYEIFLFLKHLFEKEVNMDNVKHLCVKYIGVLNEKSINEEIIRTRSKIRSNTLPSSVLSHDLKSLATERNERTEQNETNETSEAREVSANGNNEMEEVEEIESNSSTNSSIVEDLWSPPDLQPNDQLKLISDNYSNDSLNKFPEVPTHLPPPPPEPQAQPQPQPQAQAPPPPPTVGIRHANTLPLDFDNLKIQNEQDEEVPLENSRPITRDRTDSHQSIYVNEDDDLNIPMIDSKTLFNELITNDSFMIIFDLRKSESFKINHINYENIMNIDPNLIENVEDYQDLYDLLRNIMKDSDFLKFKNVKSFEKCVVYTDDKNFLSFQFDYILKFKDLMKFAKIVILKGGFDSWIKFISKNHSKELNKFKARKLPISSSTKPPSIPPPSPPKQHSSSAPPPPTQPPPAPYDYSKFLPQYNNSQVIETNKTVSRIAPPPPPPHQYPSQPIQHVVSTNQYQQPGVNSYQRAQHPVPSIPEQQSLNYSQQYPPQQYSPQSLQYTQPYPQQYYQYQSYPQFPPHSSGSLPHPPLSSSSNLYASPHISKSHQISASSSRPRNDSVPTLQQSTDPYKRLSITGLRNMGSTCYINSMIQSLFATTKFRDIFINDKFEEYLNPNFRKNKLSFALATLFKKMYLNGGCSIIPSGFLKKCVSIRPDLKIPTEQQDTQEFLMFLLDHLHDELSNSNNVVEDYPELMSFDSNLGNDYQKWFEGLIKQGFSPISEIFQGQLKDTLKCCKCGFESSNFSTFYMLSLVIPKISPYGRKLKKIQLEDCIDLFTNEEILTGENAWDCPKCNKSLSSGTSSSSTSKTCGSLLSDQKENLPRKHRLHLGNGLGRFRNRSSSPSKKPSSMSTTKSSSKTIKSLNFVKLPPILIIHLSRFLFYDLNTKDNSIVQYPLVMEFSLGNEIVKYKLFSVVNHYGTLKSGHYTSITNKSLLHDIKDPKWYYFDDENVKTTNHGDSKIKGNNHQSSSDVYVLFYEKIN